MLGGQRLNVTALVSRTADARLGLGQHALTAGAPGDTAVLATMYRGYSVQLCVRRQRALRALRGTDCFVIMYSAFRLSSPGGDLMFSSRFACE